MRIPLLLTVLAIFQIVPQVSAQDISAMCGGDYAVVRVSTVKPGKSELFLKAVADHKAWYRSHGFPDNVIAVSPVIERDEKTHAAKISETEFVSFHLHVPTKRTDRDAAWDAYVQEYRDSSDIKTEYRTCMPNLKP